MYLESQKALYSNSSQKTHDAFPQDSQGIEAMKKSIDSLYKKLNTPHDETEQKNDQTSTEQTNQNKDKAWTDHPPPSRIHKQNLTSKLNDCAYFSKVQNSSQFGQSNKKVAKPSTPTFHAQSSLNFLKNRKQQIIMNQAMGLTYDKLQILRKSLSQIRLEKSINKSQTQNQESRTKNIQSNTDFLQENSLNEKESSKKISKVRSFSQLSKIQSILDSNDKISNKRSFLSRSRVRSPKSVNRAKSQTNSLRSSRSHSNMSKSSTTSREIRMALINSIAYQMNESRFINELEKMKNNKLRKQAKKSENQIEKKLNNLERILFEVQKKNEIKQQKTYDSFRPSEKQSFRNDFMYKLKEEIDNLTKQLSDLQKRTIEPIKTQKINKQEVKMHQIKPQTVQNHGYAVKIPENRFNYHAFSYSGGLSEGHMHQAIQNRPKSQTKITFNYKNARNGNLNPNFRSIAFPNAHLNNSVQKDFKSMFIDKNFIPNNQINPIATSAYASLNSSQNVPYTYRIQSHSFKNNSIYQHLPLQNQLQMVPQLSCHQNKTISLKNKHAIEAKRYSPIKTNNFHFMANNPRKNPFN